LQNSNLQLLIELGGNIAFATQVFAVKDEEAAEAEVEDVSLLRKQLASRECIDITRL
jgi:hypothetical protein